MTTAKINNQHDYITLRVKFDGKKTLTLTRSRNGVSCSGTEATREVLDFFEAWFMFQPKGQTIGQSFEVLRAVAEKSATAADFVGSV